MAEGRERESEVEEVAEGPRGDSRCWKGFLDWDLGRLGKCRAPQGMPSQPMNKWRTKPAMKPGARVTKVE